MFGTVVLALSLVAASGGGAGERKKKAKAEAQAKTEERILVMDVSGDALSDEEKGVVREAITHALQKQAKRAEVLSTEELRKFADVTASRQAADCDTEACLAEIGAALGAGRVVHASVSRLGARFVMNVSLIDPDNVRTLGRAAAEAADVEGLYDAVPDAVAELYGREIDHKRARADDEAGGGSPITVTGVVVGVVGLIATGATAGTMGYLFSETQSPAGDPQLKQAWLDYNQPLGIATAVSAGVLVVGGSVFVIGLIAE